VNSVHRNGLQEERIYGVEPQWEGVFSRPDEEVEKKAHTGETLRQSLKVVRMNNADGEPLRVKVGANALGSGS